MNFEFWSFASNTWGTFGVKPTRGWREVKCYMIWQMMAMLHSGRRAAKDNEGWKGIKVSQNLLYSRRQLIDDGCGNLMYLCLSYHHLCHLLLQ